MAQRSPGGRSSRNASGSPMHSKSASQAPAIHRRRVRVQAVGRHDLQPSSTRTVLRAAERATAGYDALILTIAIAYGGREEIADAVRDLVRDKVRHGADLGSLVEA